MSQISQIVSWYERDLGMDQCFAEVFGSAVPTHQFLVVDEICSWVSSKHFPVVENDVSEGVVMRVVGGDEEALSTDEDCVCTGVGTSKRVLLCCLVRRAASCSRWRGYPLLRK